MYIKQTYIILFSTLLTTSLFAQPVISSKQIIEGFEIYQDFNLKNTFFYTPAQFELARYADGKPAFQLVQMRYTGAACSGDQGEKHFLNLAQFTVEMQPIEASTLKRIRQILEQEEQKIILKPIPIQNISSALVTPIGADAEGHIRYKRLGHTSEFSAQGSYWEERVFNLKLENYEAELLWNQLKDGQLSISFSYTLYANAIWGDLSEISISGDSSLVQELEETSELAEVTDEQDTLVAPHIIHSNSFPIFIDTNKWPESIKRLDINEGLPPSYPALQLACYDFADDLRPDLALKKVEVEAIGINGQPLNPISVKFSKAKPNQNSMHLYFPYAVRMERPIRYRTIEYSLEGKALISDWKETFTCMGLIDVTTHTEKNQIIRQHIELEADQEAMREQGFEEVIFSISYFWNSSPRTELIQLQVDAPLPVQELTFKYHRDQPVSYRVVWKSSSGQIERGPKMELDASYYFLNPPQSESVLKPNSINKP